jgi:hypothetical protein
MEARLEMNAGSPAATMAPAKAAASIRCARTRVDQPASGSGVFRSF